MLAEIGQSLEAKYQKPLHISDEAMDFIASQGYSEEYGVRHLRRTVQTLVEAPLSRLILSGELKDWQEVEVAVTSGMIVIQPRKEGASTGTQPEAQGQATVCCECGCAIAEAERGECAWIGGMFICAPCKAGVGDMAKPSDPKKPR
jgi:hypothetical protein